MGRPSRLGSVPSSVGGSPRSIFFWSEVSASCRSAAFDSCLLRLWSWWLVYRGPATDFVVRCKHAARRHRGGKQATEIFAILRSNHRHEPRLRSAFDYAVCVHPPQDIGEASVWASSSQLREVPRITDCMDSYVFDAGGSRYFFAVHAAGSRTVRQESEGAIVKSIRQTVNVYGVDYQTVERAGIIKAYLNGYFGWTSVWADTIPAIVRRIKQVRTGGQQ